MIIGDDVATAAHELEAALERVSQRIIADQLCVLDNSIGMSVSRLVLTKFQLMQAERKHEVEVPDVETETEWQPPTAPLTLAAAASSESATVFDVEPEPMVVPHEMPQGEFKVGTWD